MEIAEQKALARPVNTSTEFGKLTWVSNKPMPLIGTEVNVTINGIGRSVVKKYFVEHGFIGLLVQPLNPPDWYKTQNASTKDSDLYDWQPCHVYPAEVTELQVRNDEGKTDSEFYDSTLKSFDQQEVQA